MRVSRGCPSDGGEAYLHVRCPFGLVLCSRGCRLWSTEASLPQPTLASPPPARGGWAPAEHPGTTTPTCQAPWSEWIRIFELLNFGFPRMTKVCNTHCAWSSPDQLCFLTMRYLFALLVPPRRPHPSCGTIGNTEWNPVGPVADYRRLIAGLPLPLLSADLTPLFCSVVCALVFQHSQMPPRRAKRRRNGDQMRLLSYFREFVSPSVILIPRSKRSPFE